MTGDEKGSFSRCLWTGNALRHDLAAYCIRKTNSSPSCPPVTPLSKAETIMKICDTFANTNPIIIASRPSVNRFAKFSQIQKDPNGSFFV